ncbi:cryptochrome-1-like [Chenopodium quinoa]|uniref:Photolyase/cryptochrome alpha/beta domain-containing protein n=1 Tax=Chenopodium quinoa TaxID=63459 RepID=A0A803LMR6_CHEQI|nr:cryptochrome-1-like [Chenopodium quinoa]XP_021721918.1 cryptochrome-1-like [Chenopodium quinoa]
MGSSSKTIVWFRRDLRIEDNPALAAAARDGSVLPVYIWCPKEEGQFYPGRVSRWWLKESLIHLDQSLRSLGVELVLIKAESTLDAMLECINATGANKVVFNRLYDPVSLVRDHNIKQKLGELNISVHSYNRDLLYEPWEVYDEKGHAFTTFAPFWDKCLNMHMDPASFPTPWRLVPATGSFKKFSIRDLGLENDSEKSSNDLLKRAWSPGWTNANKALTEFVEQHLLEYSKCRVKVGGNSTSLLSPYLHFGELSVRKVFHSVQMKLMVWANEGNSCGLESANMYLRAIGFREYSRYLCFNFPFTHERSLLSNLKYFPWNSDQTLFKAWRQGRTGYPLVDAGMRELWATGWTHNRMRVIVASFCVKFLLLPWRWGMKYFWDTLLDADLECDILGWQYISGSLPDGHDLHRLDDPELQGSKYDPEGEYIRQWLPELARMPAEWIHHPWDAPATVLKAAGVELGFNYPKPVIEIDTARENLTEAICLMQGKAGAEETNGTNEVVVDSFEKGGNTGDTRFDNSEIFRKSSIPEVVLNGKPSCISGSSRDQRVPSMQNMTNNLLPNGKRPRITVEDRAPEPNMNACYENTEALSVQEEDMCSTAESSSAKKQTTSSFSFCVPHGCSVSSKGKELLDCESSDVKPPWKEHVDEE